MSRANRQEILAKLQDSGGMFAEMRKESDRAFAVLAGAYLDAQLEQALRNFMVDDDKVVEHLLQPDQALGSFGTKINISYSLGLIGWNMHHDLKLVQKIRNRFAHELHGLAFSDQKISSWCSTFKLQAEEFSEPRDAFYFVASLMFVGLAQKLSKPRKKHTRFIPIDFYDHICGDTGD